MRVPPFAERIGQILPSLRPGIEASLDPMCIVDAQNRLVTMNLSMKSLLGLKLRQLEKGILFCDIVKLHACRRNCQVTSHILAGEVLQLDEEPAVRLGQKCRLTVRIVPLQDPSAVPGAPSIGGIISARDSTGEIVLQAKYHKAIQIIEARNLQVQQLEEKLEVLRQTIRRARETPTF